MLFLLSRIFFIIVTVTDAHGIMKHDPMAEHLWGKLDQKHIDVYD